MSFRGFVTVFVMTVLLMPATAIADHVQCTDDIDGVHALTLPVNGEEARGLYALPSTEPTSLIVYNHGYGHTAFSWVHWMREAAKRGAVAVTMDYRGLRVLEDTDGDGLPGSRGFNVWKGAEDSNEAGRFFAAMCPTSRRMKVLFSTSLGANVGGVALAMQPKTLDGAPLFDYWIDNEGETNLIESYTEARLAAAIGITYAVGVVQDIEEETGGPIHSRFEEFRKRTVVMHGPEIKASGIKGAVVIHGVDDGLVPYNQGREMAAVLTQQRIPVDMFNVVRRSRESERETSLSGYAGGVIQSNYTSPLAGHASEKSPTHIINKVAFGRLWELLAGQSVPCYREYIVDEAANRTLLRAHTDLLCI